MESERYVGQRGSDIEPRKFNPKSLLNLKQFQKPVSEASLSVNSGVNWTKVGKIVIILFAISAIIWKIKQKKNSSD
jgi:uncharacterized protein YybS (DUF2232 family)